MIKEAFDQYKAYKPEAPVDFDAFKQQYIAAHPEATALAKPVGESFGKYLEEQANRDKAEHERQTGEMSQRNKDLGFSNALIAASQQTRGTKGIGSLGPALAGFGTSVNASTAAEDERLNALNVKRREQDMLIAKYRNELETAQRAAAEGDMTKSLESRNKAIATKNEAALKGIDVATHLAAPLATLESARIMADKSHATPEAIQLADRLIKENPKLTFEQALNKVAENRTMGQLGSAQERLQENYAKSRQAIVASYRMLQGDPKMQAKMEKELRDLDAQYRAFGLTGAPTETPAPTATPGLLPPPTGKFGVATEVKP